MKIAFDVSQTGRLKAGCGYFADSLIRSLAELDTENAYILQPTFGDFFWDPDWPVATCHISHPNFRRGHGHTSFAEAQCFWRKAGAEIETALDSPDVIHSNNFFCPIRLPKARLVYTLHDLAFLEYPEWTTEPNRLGCFTGVFHASLHADLIVAISDYSRRHFLKTFPHYPEDRAVVIYPASRFSTRQNVSQPVMLPQLQQDRFWLNVGTLEPRKNHQRLLQAYARLKTRLGQSFPLVLVGGRGWLMNDFEQVIDALELRQDVILLGYVDDDVLQWLYEHCFAFIYPSLFEGFGLPVLEAMGLGAPTITSNTSSLPEIVDSAGVLVDPLQVDAIFQAMLQFSLGDVDRTILRHRAIERVKHFSWHRAAEQILALYHMVV